MLSAQMREMYKNSMGEAEYVGFKITRRVSFFICEKRTMKIPTSSCVMSIRKLIYAKYLA